MEAMIASPPSSNLNLLSYTHKTTAFKSTLSFTHHLSKNNTINPISLSISTSLTTINVLPPNSSHAQTEIDDPELPSEESQNQNTIEAETVHVKFQLQRRCSFGQCFLLVGDDPVLGSWDPKNAIPMNWSDGHVWTVDVDIPIGRPIKFKFIKQERNRKFIWQPGHDRILEMGKTDKTITLCEEWEHANSRKIFIDAAPTFKRLTDDSINVATQKENIATEELAITMTKSKTTAADNNGASDVKENPIEAKGHGTNLKRKSGSRDRVPVLVPSLRPLPATDA